MRPIAKIYTDFPEKFGLPRQSGLVENLRGKIVFEPEYRDISAVRGLEEYSHIWLLWEFSGFKGGAQVLFGATGGFIFGFLFLAAFCGAAEIIKNKYLKILPGFAGLAVCHLLGTVQYALIYKMEFVPAFLLVSAPYLLKDAISVVLAFLPAVYIKRLLLKMHIG